VDLYASTNHIEGAAPELLQNLLEVRASACWTSARSLRDRRRRKMRLKLIVTWCGAKTLEREYERLLMNR